MGGRFVDTEKTIAGFKDLVAGNYDDLPENAFYMVGDIEEAVANAQKMAASVDAQAA
jgi:F-type H+/Na+-transporting ATPase subunit beta